MPHDPPPPGDQPGFWDTPPEPWREPDPRHFARHRDPINSHIAAIKSAPDFNTRKGRVLRVLQAANGRWVSGVQLCAPGIGGSEGLRRLRELRRDHGYKIEERPAPGPGRNSWEYRLVPE